MAIISVLHVEDHGDPKERGSQGDEEEECRSDEVDHWDTPWVEVREGAQTVDLGSFHRTQHWRSGRGDSVSRQPWFSTCWTGIEQALMADNAERISSPIDTALSVSVNLILFPP